MLKSALGVLVLWGFAGHLHAAGPASGQPSSVEAWIMTYDEIMALSPDHRRDYLVQLRWTIIDLEKGVTKDERVASQSQGFLQLIDKALSGDQFDWMPEAQADGPCPGPEKLIGDWCVVPGVQRKPIAGYDCQPQPSRPGTYVLANFVGSPRDTSPDGLICRHAPPQSPGSTDSRPMALNDSPPPKNEAPPAGNSDSCTALVPTCGNREEHRKLFYQKMRPCLYAGNISQYPGRKAAPGKCLAPSQANSYGGKAFPHCRAGLTICNPMVFGLNKDTTPYCVPPGPEATRKCDS